MHSEYPSLSTFLTDSRGHQTLHQAGGLQWMVVLTGARGWHCLLGFSIWESTGEEHKHERCFEGIMSFHFHRDISCHPIVRSRAPFSFLLSVQQSSGSSSFPMADEKVLCVQICTCYIYIWKRPCEQQQGLWHLVIAHSSFIIAKIFSHTRTQKIIKLPSDGSRLK